MHFEDLQMAEGEGALEKQATVGGLDTVFIASSLLKLPWLIFWNLILQMQFLLFLKVWLAN